MLTGAWIVKAIVAIGKVVVAIYKATKTVGLIKGVASLFKKGGFAALKKSSPALSTAVANLKTFKTTGFLSTFVNVVGWTEKGVKGGNALGLWNAKSLTDFVPSSMRDRFPVLDNILRVYDVTSTIAGWTSLPFKLSYVGVGGVLGGWDMLSTALTLDSKVIGGQSLSFAGNLVQESISARINTMQLAGNAVASALVTAVTITPPAVTNAIAIAPVAFTTALVTVPPVIATNVAVIPPALTSAFAISLPTTAAIAITLPPMAFAVKAHTIAAVNFTRLPHVPDITVKLPPLGEVATFSSMQRPDISAMPMSTTVRPTSMVKLAPTMPKIANFRMNMPADWKTRMLPKPLPTNIWQPIQATSQTLS